MSEALPITTNISVRFAERRWMRSAKAWRCFIDIPGENELPAALTAMIDRQARIELTSDGINVVIDPAFIVDVPSKKKQFQIVVETVYESQATLGPRLTALTDTSARMTISPVGSRPQPAATVTPSPTRTDGLDAQTIKGLHASFFANPKFWQWLGMLTGENVHGPQNCKATFKAWLQVESCKDINLEDFQMVLKNFNLWLNNRGGSTVA